MSDYKDDNGEVHLQVPTIEHRPDICENMCPNKTHLHPHDLHPATQRLIHLRLMIDGGRVYDVGDIHSAEWQILGEMKRIQENKRLADLAIMMFGTK